MNALFPSQKDHLNNFVSHLIGEVVTIKRKNGVTIEGILDPDTIKTFPRSFTLSLCCQLRPEQRILSDPKILVNVKDIALLKCDTLTVAEGSGNRGVFATDSGIAPDTSIQAGGSPRELRRWVPEGPEPPQAAAGLESKKDATKWDQFAANEKLFGVKTAFDESMYTTPIDRSSLHFKDRVMKAELLAREIQAAATRTTNVHLMEERSGELLGDEADEEALYGAVLRDDSCPPGFSIPAASDRCKDDDDVVRLPSQFSQFEEDRRKITQEFTAAQEELEREVPIEIPQSIKSKLNPSAQEFVPSDAYNPYSSQDYMAEYPPQQQQQQQQSYYYYYDEYGNCYCYNPYSSLYCNQYY